MTSATKSRPAELVGGAHRVPVPRAARALGELARVDYEDAFTIETAAAGERTAAEWAQAIVEGASPSAGARAWSAFAAVGVLPRWEPRRSAPDFALLGGSARVGLAAELLFKVERDTVLFATFVQLRNPFARALWAGLVHVHRRVAPYLLEHAR
jgi:hypothetical protein